MSFSQSPSSSVAAAQALGVDLALGAHEPRGHLLARHLEREDRDRHALADADVRGDVERERGLAHARAGGEHDQVGVLEAGGEVVELAEAAGDAGQVAAVVGELGEAVERLA